MFHFYAIMKHFLCRITPGAFDDEEVTHVDGEVNPVRDLETIHDELRLKDEQYCTNRLVSCQSLSSLLSLSLLMFLCLFLLSLFSLNFFSSVHLHLFFTYLFNFFIPLTCFIY